MTKQRIARISLVGILMFALLLGGQILYKNTWVNGRLAEDSRRIDGVVSVQVNMDNGQKVLEVTTEGVKNLAKTGQQLETLAGKNPIRIKDQRTSELEKVLNQMEFAIQEGIARGNYMQMEETLRQQAAQAGVTLELSMDSDRIYVNLTKENAQLLEVFERHADGRFLPSTGQ